MLKAEAWALCSDAPTWLADAIDFRRQAKDTFTLSMRQKIDVARLDHEALQTLPETVDGDPPLGTQTEMPTLGVLLSEE